MMRGEVWWSELPGEKPRPVLVLTRPEAIEVLQRVVVAPITTTFRGIPTEVGLDSEDGMPKACVVSLDNIAPIRKSYLVHRITTLPPQRMIEACQALARGLAC